jgi:hypothetical protein
MLDISENSFSECLLLRFKTQCSQVPTTVHDPLLKFACFWVAKIHISHSYFVCKEKRRFEIYSFSMFDPSISLHSYRFLLTNAIEAYLTIFFGYRMTYAFILFSSFFIRKRRGNSWFVREWCDVSTERHFEHWIFKSRTSPLLPVYLRLK